ncbi:unnamed protein product [Porites evermanni]|uniref:Uncharacterized protein n=1 Tax=Porites evermanni TaxID=104178 RepID=A0ABN8SLM2_9CNID|nr:unnamed protein product [Porites evermanni]
MAAKDGENCKQCKRWTKYRCIRCKVAICNLCSEPEIDESVDGWIGGKNVGYCFECETVRPVTELLIASRHSYEEVEEKIERQMNAVDSDDDEDGEDESLSRGLFEKKKKSQKCSKNKSGRKAKWSQSLLGDLVDIVISYDYYKNKFILTNTKNQKNGEIYKKVLVELKERAAVRNEEVPFDHVQLRTKFKKAIAECKKTSLTMKTSTGIKRFIDEKGYGPWFNSLFAIAKTRDACRPELAVESSFVRTQSPCLPDSEASAAEASPDTSSSESKERVVATRRRKRKTDESLHEVIDLIKTAINNDPVKEVLSYMSDQAQKSREHERNMLQMLLQAMPTQHVQPTLQERATAAANLHGLIGSDSRQYEVVLPTDLTPANYYLKYIVQCKSKLLT